MTDRELMELAAKAAEIDLKWSRDDDLAPRIADTWEIWNPLKDDGDALRLAVKLRMELDLLEGRVAVRTPEGVKVLQDVKDCRELATRRAIVRAAAEIGKLNTVREENLALVAKLRQQRAEKG